MRLAFSGQPSLLARRKNTIFKDSTLNLEYCDMKTIWHGYDLSLMVDGLLACETKKKCKKRQH